MVGDGETGELAGEDASNGPESESAAPSSRGRRAALASRSPERTDPLSPTSSASNNSGTSALRLALEREIHRFQAGGRQGRVRRKKASRAKAEDNVTTRSEGSGSEQPVSSAVRTRSSSASKSPAPDRLPAEDAGPASLRGTPADAGRRSLDESVAWDAPTEETTEPSGGISADERATSEKATRRTRRRPSKRSFETRLTLSVIEARFARDLAAYVARGGVVPEAPPLPYRPTNYEEAFELTSHERRALAKDQILRPNAKVSNMVAEALAAVAFLDRMRPLIAALPVAFEQVDRIATYARALSHSDARLGSAMEITLPEFASLGETFALTRPQRLQRMVHVALAARRRLHSELKGLTQLGYLPVGAFSQLKGGRGHYNVATDVLSLLELRQRAVAAGAHSNITAADLQEYNTLACTLIDTSAKAAAKGTHTARDLAIEERARAYTLLALAYREAQHALMFIFRDQLAVRAVLPTLLTGVGRKAKG